MGKLKAMKVVSMAGAVAAMSLFSNWTRMRIAPRKKYNKKASKLYSWSGGGNPTQSVREKARRRRQMSKGIIYNHPSLCRAV